MAEASPNLISSAGWQILGELFLPVGFKPENDLEAWLVAALDPLDLPSSLLRKVSSSAISAVERILLAPQGSGQMNVSLLLYASTKASSSGQAWGFCQIEKNEFRLVREDLPEAVIEIYLYEEV